jgi:signal transduction histidine kinase
MVVDDNVLERMGAADMFLDAGYRVIEAGNAAEALRLLVGGPAIVHTGSGRHVEAISAFQEALGIQEKLDDKLPQVPLDRGQMKQVLVNLARNAMQATIDPATIRAARACHLVFTGLPPANGK